MSYRVHPRARAELLGRALLARIDDLPINEAHRDEARLHFARAEALSERLFQWLSRVRQAPAVDSARVAFERRVIRQ